MSGFLLDLATLPPGRSRVVLEADAVTLDLPTDEWSGPIRGEIDVELSGEQVSVRGRLSASAAMQCVRCLKRFDFPVGPSLEIYAERTGRARRPRDEDELERDGYMAFHDGRRLDLSAQAREALLLEIPMAPCCREDCRGLCPRCGADLNNGPCGCAT
jgi:uncharacterized protein